MCFVAARGFTFRIEFKLQVKLFADVYVNIFVDANGDESGMCGWLAGGFYRDILGKGRRPGGSSSTPHHSMCRVNNV